MAFTIEAETSGAFTEPDQDLVGSPKPNPKIVLITCTIHYKMSITLSPVF